MSRSQKLADAQWSRIQSLIAGFLEGGRPFWDERRVVEAIIFRYRTGIHQRDLPEESNLRHTLWKRHMFISAEGTWDRIHQVLLTDKETTEQRH